MRTVLSVIRGYKSALFTRLIAAAFAALLPCAPCAAADESAISELNRRVAIELRTAAMPARRPVLAHAYSYDADHPLAPDAAGPLGRRFTLPGWAVPLARANRLLYVHAGGFEFDGWSALIPRGVVRMKFTVRF